MSLLKDLSGSYCKVALIPSKSSKGIVQSGFVKNVDTEQKIIILENENGVVRLPFNQIRAVRRIQLKQHG
jgi:hypothetical protein